MNRWYYIVLCVILLGGVVYMYVHRQDLGLAAPADNASTSASSTTNSLTGSPPTADRNGAALKPPHIVWTLINRSKEGFQVELPTDAREIQIPAFNENGGTDQVEMLYAYPDSGTSFSVARADEPPVERVGGTSADKTLDTARDDALARTRATLVS